MIVGGQTNWTADDPDIAQLAERAEQLGVRERVQLRGHVPYDRVPEVLSQATVTLLPLPDEPVARLFTSPLKLFDYMAAGVPIVASDLPALREVLQHEENALLATPGDSDAFAAAVRRLIADPALARRLGQQAREDVKGYSWDARAEALLDFLAEPSLAPRMGAVTASVAQLSGPMRILVVTWELQPESGWGRYSLGLVRGLLERGHQLTILTTRNTRAPKLDTRVIPCLSTPLGALDRPLPFAWNMAQVLRHAPGHDLVHFFVEPFGLAASAIFPWPYLITVHGTYGVSPFRMNAVTRTLFARTLKRAASVVCVSNYTRRRMREVLPLGNLDVVTNGFEPLTVPVGKYQGRDHRRTGHHGVRGAQAAKGYHTVLEALPRVRERYPDIHFYLVGDDQDRKYVAGLRERIERLNLARNATITGRIDEAHLDALYRRADAFVLPSENSGAAFEGFGLAYIEANAYGKPVLAPWTAAPRTRLMTATTACWCRSAIPKRSLAILRLLDDPAAAQAMGERGRARSNSRDWSHVVEEYLALYKRALRGGRRFARLATPASCQDNCMFSLCPPPTTRAVTSGLKPPPTSWRRAATPK